MAPRLLFFKGLRTVPPTAPGAACHSGRRLAIIHTSRCGIKNLSTAETLRRNTREGPFRALPVEGTRKISKTSVPAILLPGEARDKEIESRLREGWSFLQVATFLERTPEFIAREAKRILGQDALSKVLARKKKGEWAEDETRDLIRLRRGGALITKIAHLLRRTKPSIKEKLREIGSAISETGARQGPRELPPGLQESLFSARLENIWKGLLQSDMTPSWREALRERPAEEWLSRVSAGIPEESRRLLGGLQPPTGEELESLPPVATSDAGVFARLVFNPYEVRMDSDRYLFVGSASKYDGGLLARKRSQSEKGLSKKMKKKHLVEDVFVTLMTMKMDDSSEQSVLDVRRTVTIAKSILRLWLGALGNPPHDLRVLYPWYPETPGYNPWCLINPLTKDIKDPVNVSCAKELIIKGLIGSMGMANTGST